MSQDYFGNINMEYVDGIMIVDNTGRIVYSVRFNPRFDDTSNNNEFKKLINKNFMEIYPDINPEDSTIIKCLQSGKALYEKNQNFYDYKNRLLNTQNLTLPIIKRGKIVGAVELSKDITRIQENNNNHIKYQNSKFKFAIKTNSNDFVARYTLDDIITQNTYMLDNIKKASLISKSPSPVLIYGETGTGKELFIQAIHNCSKRRNAPFIAQNCAALPETLFESILFGSTKGAFTGSEDKNGLFELADGGTLFLDEVNSIPYNLQAKLLRVIQEGYVRRIGDYKDRKVNVRIVASMNVDPIRGINDNQIRPDLLYRLNVASIKLLPLRDRKEDIDLFITYFIKKYNELLSKNVKGVTKEVKTLLTKYNWPGNVRELQHIIEGSMNIVENDKISIKHLPIYLKEFMDGGQYLNSLEDSDEITPLGTLVESIEKEMIKKALKRTGGNISKAGRLLEVPRQTLQYKIDKYNINHE